MATLLSLSRLWSLLLCLSTLFTAAQAQTNCAFSSVLSQGYTVSIQSVTANPNGSHTIVLKVLNNGCSGCKKINSFAVQAAAGTYSNVSVQLISGAFTYANISMGPTLSSCSYTGFRINNTNGMGSGLPAAFTVTYTLTGPFQNQLTEIKAGSNNLSLISNFTAANFQAVKTCQTPPPPTVIFPYFTPYANKSYDIIGVELTSLYNIYLSTGTYISNDIFQILGTSVRVSIRTKPGQHEAALALLAGPSYGLVQELNDPANNLINGTFPILKLLTLNQLPTYLVSVRPIYAALGNAGLITSQGDTALRSFRARGVFGVDGTGVKVGVISDSYNTKLGNPAADDVQRGDLPGLTNAAHPTPVDVLQDYPFGTRTDEGRAMLQIVHDIAPGADLAFRTGFVGAVDMAKGIKELQAAGCDVIVDDVSYISEPMFRDGVIAQAVNDVKALGVSYFSAAGNFGTSSWQGTYSSAAAPAGVTGTANDFNPGTGVDILQGITLYSGEYTIVFQWDDGTAGTTTNSDYDIYLASTTGSTLFGFNRMNVGGDPVEILPFVVTADSVQSNIVIVRETGTAAATLKYVVYRGKVKVNEYGGYNASTLTGQANAAGAMAVGAVLYTNTPEYGGVPSAASFSSRGGTPVNGALRPKPDFCAPNGVNTSVDLGGVNYDNDAFPNFFGTSAAAPHAAGVAALLMEARTKYYGDVLAPDGVKNLLQNTAVDMGTPGFDVSSGAGYITADKALSGLANPSAYITSIAYDTTLTPGVDTLVLTVYGEYLNAGSSVWLDGAPLNNGVVIQGDSAIVTLVQPFSGLYPEIQVYNPPLAGTNGQDGGLSNPLYFTTKETILITVDDKSKKYGEVLPGFTASYSRVNVDGSIPLASAGLTPAQLARIHAIDLTTIATPLSNVGLWAISGDPNDPLNPKSTVTPTDPLDLAILQAYNIVFDDGLLTIDPAALTITPRDTTIVYGQLLDGLNFDYTFSNGSGGLLNATTSGATTLLTTVKSAHGTALVNAIGLVRGTALVNEAGEQLLTDDLLSNFSVMISQAVKSARGTALVNGELIDPTELYNATAFTNATARLVRGTALVNAYKLVRGTALVNTIDLAGNITNTSSLVNSASLVNNSASLNSSTITLDSNSETLVILGDEDVAILSGNATGNVDIRSVSVITGNTVGTHRSIPGTFLTNNFNVKYGLGNITVLPATAQFTIATETLAQTYTGAPLSIGVTVVPDTVPYTITYNGSAAPPVNAGTYAVHIEVNDPNYVGSLDATLVVQQATASFTITPSTLAQTYNGTPKSVSVTSTPAGVAYTVAYNGSATAPTNAGSYPVVVTANDPNYTGTVSATLVVQKANATFTINTSSCTQTYNGTPKTVIVTSSPAGVAFTITYGGSATAPTNAGSYAVVVTSSDPNYTGSSTGTLVIQKATATFTLSSLTQVYSASAKSVGVSSTPAGVAYTVTYNGSATQPVNAGSYSVVVTANSTNYTGSKTGTLVVQKAPATATTGVYFISKGQSIPSFSATYSGLLAGQTASVVSSVSFSLSPTCTGNAGVYQIIVNATAANYTFTSVNGTLYINPAGAGTKQVKPNFICYMVLNPPVNGYSRVAYFNYENQNSTPVYIPVGANNSITGTAYDASQRPVVFMPGVSAPIAIPYNGTSLTWQVTSNKSTGGSGSIPANTSNTVCTSPGVKIFNGHSDEEPILDAEVRVYPNPSTGKVFLDFTGGWTEGTILEVYNTMGSKCAVRIDRTADQVMEVDLSSLGAGMYIINVFKEDGLKSYPVVIE